MEYEVPKEWINPKPVLKIQSKRFGPLSLIKEQHRVDPTTFRLKIVDSKGTEHSKVSYWNHPPEKGLIYVYHVDTSEESKRKGMSRAILGLLSAVEGKNLFLIPNKFAEDRDIFKKVGFHKGKVDWDGVVDCLRMERANSSKQQTIKRIIDELDRK